MKDSTFIHHTIIKTMEPLSTRENHVSHFNIKYKSKVLSRDLFFVIIG